jgi:hypothetical protein
VSSLPMKYFGLLLKASFRAKSIWDGVIEKIERCSARWKSMYLSKGGRVTLIKSTLSNLSMYFLFLFPLLFGIANRIEKLQHISYGVGWVMSSNFTWYHQGLLSDW